jgi:hypothetical protein
VCDCVRFSVGGVWGARSNSPCCVLRACSGVRVVMVGQCAVVAAVRDVVRARGARVFLWCV